MYEKKYAIYLNKDQLQYMAEAGVNILSEHNHELYMELKKDCEDFTYRNIKIDGNNCLIPAPDKEYLNEVAESNQNYENLFDQIVETWKEDNFILE